VDHRGEAVPLGRGSGPGPGDRAGDDGQAPGAGDGGV